MTEILRVARVREPLDPRFIDKAQRVYSELQAGVSHPPPCSCPACLFNQYQSYPRGAGAPFSKETFFFDWLSWEIRFSMLKITTAYIREEWEEKFSEEKKLYDLREYIRVRGYIAEMIKFLIKNKNRFPTIRNINPGRIKLSLWRFRKSGVGAALEKEITLSWLKSQPRKPKKERTWGALGFAQRVSDFIRLRPGRKASYREIQRRFNKKKSDIENVLWALRGNYQMKIIKRGASSILVYSPPSIEQVKAYVQERVKEIIKKEKALFGDEKRYKKSAHDNF